MTGLADVPLRWLDGWLRHRGLKTPSAFPWHTLTGKILLHVGCGHARKDQAGPGFRSPDWTEVRLDIDPAVVPDIVTSMSDMAAVPTGIADGVFSSHSIEHLYPHEVPAVLGEFLRVLKPDGLLVLTCPDLQSICQRVVAGLADDPAYLSPVGPITPLDMLYGHQAQLAAGNHYMAHRFGFTLETLCKHLHSAGFVSIGGFRREAGYDLWVLASPGQLEDEELQRLLQEHLPN